MDQVESVEPNPAAAKKMTDFIDLEWLTYIDLKPKCVLTRKNQLLAQILTRDSPTQDGISGYTDHWLLFWHFQSEFDSWSWLTGLELFL